MLDNTANQPSKFRTKNWVELSDDSGGVYNTNSQIKSNSQIKFKTVVLKSILCDYSDVYIVVKMTIMVSYTAAAANDAK